MDDGTKSAGIAAMFAVRIQADADLRAENQTLRSQLAEAWALLERLRDHAQLAATPSLREEIDAAIGAKEGT